MRQAFRPASTATDAVSQLRLDPNNPNKPALNYSVSKTQAQKTELPTSKATKAPRDTPDPMSNTFGRRNSTPLAPSLGPPHPRRQSLDKAPHANGASKKKVKIGTERPVSKLAEISVNEDEKAYFADMEIIDISQDPMTEGQEILSVLNKSVENNRKRAHQTLDELIPADTKGSKTYGKHNQERPTDTAKRHQKGNVTFSDTVSHKHGYKASKTIESDGQSSSDESDGVKKPDGSSEDDDSIDIPKHTQISAAEAGKNPDVELGYRRDSVSSSPGFPADVIDTNVKRRNREYETRVLYISDKDTWAIPHDSIPIEPHKVLEWENTGQRIAVEASQLITDYIALRRSKASLFDRVKKRVAEHRDYLEDRDQALVIKLNNVSSQCETLIHEVKTGTI